MVTTLDSESSDLSSNLGGTYAVFFIVQHFFKIFTFALLFFQLDRGMNSISKVILYRKQRDVPARTSNVYDLLKGCG